MRIKFDDGEHATVIEGDAIGNVIPEMGDIIEWESEPENDDELASGRYYVSGTTWTLGKESRAFMVTLHLEHRP